MVEFSEFEVLCCGHVSVVTKALVPETEAPGFEAKTEAEAVASETEAR